MKRKKFVPSMLEIIDGVFESYFLEGECSLCEIYYDCDNKVKSGRRINNVDEVYIGDSSVRLLSADDDERCLDCEFVDDFSYCAVLPCTKEEGVSNGYYYKKRKDK